MSNPSKQKGTAAETKVARYLQEHGIDAERRALSGSSDKGDILVRYPAGGGRIIEVKTGQQTANPSRTQIEEWLDQTHKEMMNAGLYAADLVLVRYRRSIEDADVYTINAVTNRRLHSWLDEYVEHLKRIVELQEEE